MPTAAKAATEQQTFDDLILAKIRKGIKGSDEILDAIVADIGPMGLATLLEDEIYRIAKSYVARVIWDHRNKALRSSSNGKKNNKRTRGANSRSAKADIWFAQWNIGLGNSTVRKTTAELTEEDCEWLAANYRRLAGHDIVRAEWFETNARLIRRKKIRRLGDLRKLGVELPALPEAA